MKKILSFVGLLFVATFIFVGFSIPVAHAQLASVLINEIKLDGTQWVEIMNTTAGDINLTSSTWDLVRTEAGPAGVATTTLSGLLPAHGLLTFAPSALATTTYQTLLTLKNDGATIYSMSYGSSTPLGGEPVLEAFPGAGESGVLTGGTTWSATTTITKGWYNEGPAPTVASIITDLNSANLATNLGSGSIPDTSAATGLYFEKYVGSDAVGRITFTSSLNLTNASTTDILQNLGTEMEAAAGSLSFDARTATALKDAGATISIYHVNDLWYDVSDLDISDLTVEDDDGLEIATSSGSYPSLSLVSTSTNNGGTFTFTTDHFTGFGFNPELAEVTPIATLTASTSPYYTFSSNVAGTAVYGGDCTMAAASTTVGNNTIQFGPLTPAAYANCTVKVIDGAGASSTLAVSSFTVVDEAADMAAVIADRDTLTEAAIKGANASLASTTVALAALPATGTASSSVITWASASTTIISNNGQTVNRPAFGSADATTTLTATITKNLTSTTTVFNITVLASLNSAKAITSFTITNQVGSTTISETDHTITVVMPNGTNVTALVPTITITGASVSPVSGTSTNFTSTTTFTVTAGNASTQAYVVTVQVLEATQTAPDGTGAATISTTTPEVVITDPAATTTLTINSGVTNPTIDVSAFIGAMGTGTIPAINITANNASGAEVVIPASTLVTSASTTWDGVMSAPTVTTVTLPTTSGYTKTVSSAIELGFSGVELTFDKGVRILIPDQAGKRVGYTRDAGATFTEITAVCAADNQATGDALAAGAECKIDVSGDLVIWTKHFTTFASYTQTESSSGHISGSAPVIVAVVPTVAQVTAGVASTNFKFVTNLELGSKGADVVELQKALVSAGYLVMPVGVSMGNFGPLTKAAVIKYQLANNISPAVGYVGPVTRAKLNESKGMSISTFVKLLIQLGLVSPEKEALINSIAW